MLSAVDVLRMVERFDPNQLRGPDGQWIDEGSAILRKVFKFGGNAVTVTVHDDDSRTLDFGAGRSVRLQPHELSGGYRDRNNLRGIAFHVVDLSPGEGQVVRQIRELPNGRVRSELLVGVKKVAEPPDVHPNGDPDEETWDLTPISILLPPNDDPSYDELMDSPPVATMRQRDLVALAELDIPAHRVETGSGSLDAYRDGGKFVLRPAGRDPLVLDRKGVKSLYGAINDLWDEEYRDPRPDTEVVEKVIQTKAGDITVRMTGEGRRTQILGAGLSLDVDEEHLLDVMSALGDSGSARESTAQRAVDVLRLARAARPSAVDVLRIAEAVDFDPKKHPRYPDGRFRPLLDRVVDAIRGGESGVLEKLSRPQLRSVAKANGVNIRRDMSDIALRNETYAHIRQQVDADIRYESPDVPAKATKAAKQAAPTAHPVDLSHLRTLDRETAAKQLAALRVEELKALLRQQKRPVSGAKPALVERILRESVSALDVLRLAEAVGTTAEATDRYAFRRYWTETPEGLAKWADKPHPWTSLYHHLRKHMDPERAKRVAAQWFHRVFHFWPGSDLNRVTHGKPPRGERIGPG